MFERKYKGFKRVFLWVLIVVSTLVLGFGVYHTAFAGAPGRKAPPADDLLKTYGERRAAFSLVDVFKVGWTGGGAFAQIQGAKELPLATIFDPAVQPPSQMFGSACALTFGLESRRREPWVDLDAIVVEVDNFEPLPKYAPVFPAPYQESQAFYVEIDDPKIVRHKAFQSAAVYSEKGNKAQFGTVRLTAQQPESFIVRVNAKRPGKYTFSVYLLLSHKNTRERVTIVEKQSFLFDGKPP